MVITIQVNPELELKLRASAARGDSEAVRQLLFDAIAPTVEAILREPAPEQLTVEEFDRVADELLEEVNEYYRGDIPNLPDEAITREGIYGDHP